MENLTEDIISDVLSRLPVKSVVRFRCVCKSWCSLISEYQFVKKHLNRAITDASVGCQKILLSFSSRSPVISVDYEVVTQNNGDRASTVLDFLTSCPNEHHEFLVSGSCNGMVCILLDRDNIILCNPCTRDLRYLSINFNGIYACGFGYDSSVDDYKILIVVPAAVSDDNDSVSDDNDNVPYDSGPFSAEVFSLRSNSWKTITDFRPNFNEFGATGGMFLNGTLHWPSDPMIITFELATEKYQGNKDDSYCDSLTVLGSYLSVSIVIDDKTQVWVMKEYGVEASWAKLFTFSEGRGRQHGSLLRPVCFSKSGELLVDVYGYILIIYNPEGETYRKLYTTSDAYWDWDGTFVYIESLVSPNFNLNQ